MKKNYTSIGKFEKGCLNEDAVMARDNVIAVSDGAGGGGLFAEKWSRYLLKNLPTEPINNANELDDWIAKIWEPFYNDCENEAKLLGSLSLDKFYDEGSFATLVSVWKTSETGCQWISFGDSVAFHYNFLTQKLQHSFTRLADFDNPPFLINCKDELKKEGFRKGSFNTDEHSVIFVTSDALAHYILMMYEVVHRELFAEELLQAESHHSKNENYIKAAKAKTAIDFEKKVLGKLINCTGNTMNFKHHLKSVLYKGLIAQDDYSIAVMEGKNTKIVG